MSFLNIFRKSENSCDEIVDTTLPPKPSDNGVNNIQEIVDITLLPKSSDKGVNNAQEIIEFEPASIPNIELYVVSWKSRYDVYSHSIKRVAKAFIREEDADKFIKDLKKAADFLQLTEDLEIRKEKQS